MILHAIAGRNEGFYLGKGSRFRCQSRGSTRGDLRPSAERARIAGRCRGRKAAGINRESASSNVRLPTCGARTIWVVGRIGCHRAGGHPPALSGTGQARSEGDAAGHGVG